jgi:NADH-quinone oxidoreductase subunit L
MDPDGYISIDSVISMGYAYSKYVKSNHVPVSDEEERPALSNLSYNKFYIDELYDKIIRKPLDAIIGILLQSG